MKKTVSLMLLIVMLASMSAQARDIWSDIGGALDDAWDATSGWVSDAADTVAGAATDAWDATSGWVSDAADTVAGAATDAWDAASGWVSTAATDAWDATSGWVSTAATDAWDSASGFFNPPDQTSEPTIVPEPARPAGMTKLYVGNKLPVYAGDDDGFALNQDIGVDNCHYGWILGRFYITGYSRVMPDSNGNCLFLKTTGDEIKLHFELYQDIDQLNGDPLLVIGKDKDGYDKNFGVPKTNFGRGALLIMHTDYQNNIAEPVIYTDYLSAKMSGTADTVISLNEEGDYAVALDYRVDEYTRVLGTSIKYSDENDYKICFSFSVRSGNCIVFLVDTATGSELRDTSVTPNGFRIDMAQSRYLDVNIKRSIIVDGAAGRTEDVRFNRPAKDGEEYTQSGIYTITIQNRYTGEQTVKQLYVGTDEKMIEYVSSGMTIEGILAAGK